MVASHYKGIEYVHIEDEFTQQQQECLHLGWR